MGLGDTGFVTSWLPKMIMLLESVHYSIAKAKAYRTL